MRKNKLQSLLVLEGTPNQCGLIHGESLKHEIHDLIDLWKENLSSSIKQDINKYLKQFLEKTNFIPSIKKWTPNLLDAIKNLFKLPKNINSSERLKNLKSRLEKASATNKLTHIKDTLMSKDSTNHPIASIIGDGGYYSSHGSFTFASTIMMLFKAGFARNPKAICF